MQWEWVHSPREPYWDAFLLNLNWKAIIAISRRRPSHFIRWDRSLFAAWDIFSVLQHKRNVFWDQIVLLSRKIPTLLRKTHIIAWCLPHRSLICRKLTVIAKYSQYSKIKAKTITFSNIALSMFLFKENPCVAQFMDNRPFPLHSCRAKSPDNTISCRNCGSLSVVKSYKGQFTTKQFLLQSLMQKTDQL